MTEEEITGTLIFKLINNTTTKQLSEILYDTFEQLLDDKSPEAILAASQEWLSSLPQKMGEALKKSAG